jgi:hypothetical protein
VNGLLLDPAGPGGEFGGEIETEGTDDSRREAAASEKGLEEWKLSRVGLADVGGVG